PALPGTAGTAQLPASRTAGSSPIAGLTATAEGIAGGAAMPRGEGDPAAQLSGVGTVPEIRRRSVGGPLLPSAGPGGGPGTGPKPGDVAGGSIGPSPQSGFIGRRRTA